MTKLREQVAEFHRAFGHETRETPSVPGDKQVRLRARLVLEEAFEFVQALVGEDAFFRLQDMKEAALLLMDTATVNVDLPEAADALADLDYVVEGSRLAFGIDGEPVADEVHRSNMAKAGGGKDAFGKTVKPPGWTPPDVYGVLERQGWKP